MKPPLICPLGHSKTKEIGVIRLYVNWLFPGTIEGAMVCLECGLLFIRRDKLESL